MTHLTPAELVDAVEHTTGAVPHSHLAACETCRNEVARLRDVLFASREIEVPEPSPLFWDHLSSRVRTAIADMPAGRIPSRAAWLQWKVLAPLGALALLVLVLATVMTRGPLTSPLEPTPQSANYPNPASAASGDRDWEVVSEIVGSVDLDQAHEAGIVVGPGDVDRAALELSAAEQQELMRLLKTEMEKAGG
ncbi:MAG TPA: hypothetical protein VEK56_08045 [Vicinamibacterales bacterium]|nr:hypothetical protein [Vicinamibacterales bacterium]